MPSVKGFTLIEILIAITITGILTTIGIINYRTFSSTQVLNSAVSDVQDILRQAQTNATASLKCGAYGSAEWLVIFNNTSVDLKCKISPDSQWTQIKNLPLPSKVKFGAITGATSCGWGFPATISFATLSGKVNFPGASSTCTSFVVPVQYSSDDINQTKTITVTLGGAIDAQ